jgi:1-acyl-sn-glycerol-3-phosphate acyltransferase
MSCRPAIERGVSPREVSLVERLKDLAVTLCLWGYFTLGFVGLFAPRYVLAGFFSADRHEAFQRLNHRFYKGFFRLLECLIPLQHWEIGDDVRLIRSSIVVSNHVSYIDPILLISFFEKHTTIAKASLFDIPVFGTMLALSGYIPSRATSRLGGVMIDGLNRLDALLAKGANLIVFPEGTRSRGGGVGRFRRGVFTLAIRMKAPIKVVAIRGSETLFQPGKFLFNTCRPNTVSVDLVADIPTEVDGVAVGVGSLMADVRRRLEAHLNR